MATFAQYLKTQLHRDDELGFFARFWEENTPGKISSVAGIGRALEKIEAQYESGDNSQAQQALGMARKGYDLAVSEYHKAETLDAAIAAGAVPEADRDRLIPPGAPVIRRNGTLGREGERTVTASASLPGPDPVLERLAALEQKAGEISELLGMVLAMLTVPEYDWDQLWQLARQESAG